MNDTPNLKGYFNAFLRFSILNFEN
jgi:hypothetical protein